MALKGFTGSGSMYWYTIAPGDGTQYRFGFMPLDSVLVSFPTSRIQGYASYNTIVDAHFSGVDALFPGTGNGIDYMLVVVAMNPSGCYEIRNDVLRNPIAGDVRYFAFHAGILPYTAATVLLALSVLLDDKDDLEGAAKAMLRAPELLR